MRLVCWYSDPHKFEDDTCDIAVELFRIHVDGLGRHVLDEGDGAAEVCKEVTSLAHPQFIFITKSEKNRDLIICTYI